MLPIHQKTNKIHFFDFVAQLEKKHGINYRDMANRYKRIRQLCADRGIDYAKWQSIQFTKMTPEEFQVVKLTENIPYQDVWHYLTDNDFDAIFDGDPICSLDLSEERLNSEMPHYVERFFRILRTELNAAGVVDDEVEFYLAT